MIQRDEETIIAQCTPTGSGALALIRLSGTHALTIAARCAQLANKQQIDLVAPNTIHFGWVIDDTGKHIDQVLFFVMHGPRTFTGQDTVEISCHNNPFVIQAIIQAAIKQGARMAQAGEFTKRAYLNKKIDLVQAEAINELISAHTQQALQKSLAQLEGSLSHWIEEIEQLLVQALTLTNASFEFIEDETVTFDEQIRSLVQESIKQLNDLEQHHAHEQHIKEGIRIALIGAVNAGKSSLFNRIVGKDRAIVTPIAGTTRDALEAGIYRKQAYWTLVDTAGMRQTHDIIEQEGIRRSLQQAQLADIVVLVFDGTRALSDQEQVIYRDLIARYHDKIIMVATKSDMVTPPTDFDGLPVLAVSSVTGNNVDLLEQQLEEKTQTLLASGNAPFLVNARQYELLKQLKEQLNVIKPMLDGNIAYEIVATHLLDALEKLTRLSGKTITEEAVNNIFDQFCIGK